MTPALAIDTRARWPHKPLRRPMVARILLAEKGLAACEEPRDVRGSGLPECDTPRGYEPRRSGSEGWEGGRKALNRFPTRGKRRDGQLNKGAVHVAAPFPRAPGFIAQSMEQQRQPGIESWPASGFQKLNESTIVEPLLVTLSAGESGTL